MSVSLTHLAASASKAGFLKFMKPLGASQVFLLHLDVLLNDIIGPTWCQLRRKHWTNPLVSLASKVKKKIKNTAVLAQKALRRLGERITNRIQSLSQTHIIMGGGDGALAMDEYIDYSNSIGYFYI